MITKNNLAMAGTFFLIGTWLMAIFTAGSALVGALSKRSRWTKLGIQGSYVVALLLTLCSSLIFFALLSNDFSIKYIWLNSESSMPWFYKLTAYWGGLDGSLMFWAWLLSVLSGLAIYLNKDRHPDLIPWVTVILMGLLIFFVGLLVLYKRPFDVFLLEVPIQGKGLNPLLQDPYMATHPPSLYIGYVSASIPFAFGLAALITGQLDERWLQSVRRWMLVCWYFLSQGLILGALWAYHVLGWGGYWGWDPVENAGLLPWFTASAFLHSIMIQERRGMLKTWNLVLVILTFLLTLVGTFLTRTGLVQSVHAFGEDSTLAIVFLTLIVGCAALSFGFVFYRMARLRARGEMESYLSREFAFVLNNWVLLGATLFVLVATLFPLFSKMLTGTQSQVGPPFFNRWMGPIGLLLLLLTGAGPLLAWRRSSIRKLGHTIKWPFLVCLVTTIVLCVFVPKTRVLSHFLSESIRIPTSLVCFALVSFVLTSLLQEFLRGALARKKATGHGFFLSMLGVVAKNRRKYGGYLVHAGIALMFFGFAGQPYGQEAFALFHKTGELQSFGRYVIRYDGYTEQSTPQLEKQEELRLRVFVDGQDAGELRPAKWSYRNRADEPPRTVVKIRSTFRDDLYIVFLGYDGQSKEASIKVMINPLVLWIWIGFSMLIFGTVLAFLPERFSSKRSAGMLAVCLLLSGLCFFSTSAQAQLEPMGSDSTRHTATANAFVIAPPKNQTEKRLRQQLVCMCGSCGRQTLSECTCGHAAKQRSLLSDLIQQEKSESEVIAFFSSLYPGDSVLVEPPRRGFYHLVWLLPLCLFGMLGAVLLIWSRRWKKHLTQNSDTALDQRTPMSGDLRFYQDQLDRDLKDENQ